MPIIIRNKIIQHSIQFAVSLHKPQRITMKHKVHSYKVLQQEDITYAYNGLAPALARMTVCSREATW